MRAAFLFLGLTATHLLAQQTSLTGPIEAITFDAPTRSLRTVIGFPGAASFGPALMEGFDLASVAPHQTYGIVFEHGRFLLVSGLNTKEPASLVIEGVHSYPDGIVWSANGSMAALYSRSGKWFQPITGLPGSPLAGSAVDLSSLNGAIAAVAVDPLGKQIIVATSGQDGSVYRYSGGQFSSLAAMAQPQSLSFSSNGQTLYALDASTEQITAIDLGGNGFQSFALPGISNPVAIQSVQDSQNRQLLYIAAGTDRIMRILDVASQQVIHDFPLAFEPTRLDPFGSGSFVLASRSISTSPLWLFSNTPQPGAYFVPAIQLHQSVHRTIAIVGRPR